MPITIAMDTGGTFTDGIFAEGDRVERVKVDTTPHDLTVCFRNCIAAGADRLGYTVPSLLAKTEVIRFSTTVGTNSVIQRKGIRLGLLVSKGYEDTLYAAAHEDANPLIPPELVRGLDEEIDHLGVVQRPLRTDAVRAAVELLLDEGARFIVASLRNSHLNPLHEQQIKATIAAEYPRHYLGAVPVLVASDISIRSGDRTRTNTAILNAYLHPAVAAFLYRAEDYLRQQGYGRPLLIAHSTGGVARVAKTTAINTFNSGPVSGLLGARHIARELYDLKDLVTMDVGGTSLDIGMVIDGRVPLEDHPTVDGLPLNIPLVEVETIGTGGGSIVRLQADGRITVGPDSAGAVPGPAAFDLGGDQPTVTDADLVLGYLSADNFLGGQRHLRKDLAEQSIQEKIAGPLGIPVTEAAWRIIQAVEQQMGTAMRTLAGRNGYDPARFALFVYGGGGGLRCAGVSRHLGHPKAYLFEHSSAFSALGADTLDVMHLYEVNLRLGPDDPDAWGKVAAQCAGLVKRAERDMRGEGFLPTQIDYRFEAMTEMADGASATIEFGPAELRHASPPAPLRGQGPAAVSILRMRAIGATPHFAFPSAKVGGTDPSAARSGSRLACCDGVMRKVSVYSRDPLRPGNVVPGPAVVEANDTTYWVPAWASLHVDHYRNCILEVNRD